jgi:hypothetical protein
MEALSIFFSSTAPFAIRVSVGGVNALTGTKTEGREGWLDVNGQQWLDGVVVSPKLVRQFVGIHAGSRYTTLRSLVRSTHGIDLLILSI